jgi:hypothetical protein
MTGLWSELFGEAIPPQRHIRRRSAFKSCFDHELSAHHESFLITATKHGCLEMRLLRAAE